MMYRALSFIVILAFLGSACRSAKETARPEEPSATPEVRALWVARMSYKTPEDVRVDPALGLWNDDAR